jgi:hypothetical protein
MKPINAVLTIAGATLVLTGCDSPQDRLLVSRNTFKREEVK